MTHLPQMPCYPLHVIPWTRDFTSRPSILFEMLKDQGKNIQDAFFVDEQSFCDDTVIVGHWASYEKIDFVRAPAHLACSLSPGANDSYDSACWHPSVLPIKDHRDHGFSMNRAGKKERIVLLIVDYQLNLRSSSLMKFESWRHRSQRKSW